MPAPISIERRLILALGAAGLLSACDKPPMPSFAGVDLSGASYARDFELQDVDGKTRRLADFRGKVLAVFFGFTQCPDVCPTTMGELKTVKEELGAQGTDLVPIFISVDPERDTAELLRQYSAAFGADFVALRGSLAQTEAVTREFKAYFKKVPNEKGDSYSVDHSAAVYLFDRQGRVRVYVRYGSGAQALLGDVKQLLAEKA
jgi:protein SCO1